MSNQSDDKYYSPEGLEGLVNTNRAVKELRDKIKYRLAQYKNGNESAVTNEKRILLEYFQDDKIGQPEKTELSVDLFGLWKTADSQSNIVDDLRQGHESFMVRKIKDERRLRAAERSDKWILWRDQLVRWVLGIVLAIFLYSGAVYYSDDHCVADDGSSPRFCIRIPIKDWIPR